jgi:hypothetical protein
MEAVDLLPVSALQMEPFQEDKKPLPDHLLRQPRHRSGLYPKGIEETTRLPGLEGFLNLPANDAHTHFTCRRSCPGPPGTEGLTGKTRISNRRRGLGRTRNTALGREDRT